MTFWPEDRVEMLARLCRDGRTPTQIARQMGGGLTRCAVIGKMHRLGLTRDRAAPAARPTVSVHAPEPEAAAGKPKAEVKPKTKSIKQVTSKIAASTPEPVPTGPEAILALRDTTCHFPIGDPKAEDFRYCLEKVWAEGKPYCGHHHALAHDPNQRRRVTPARPVTLIAKAS